MLVLNGRDPKFLVARTCWPYNCQVLNGEGEEMFERLAPDIPFNEWKFNLVPDFPDGKPILFLYGSCEDELNPCTPRQMRYYDDAFLDWVHARPGSKTISVEAAGHWMMLQQPAYVNKQMEDWLANLTAAASLTTDTTHDS